MGSAIIDVEVVYCGQARQHVLSVQVPADATVGEVIERSGILALAPEIDLSRQAVGIWGAVVPQNQLVAPGDRIEIYRPLLRNPRERRRMRAAKPAG